MTATSPDAETRNIAKCDIVLDLHITICDIAEMKPIAFTPAATRQWVQLQPAVRARINVKLESFATTGHGDVKKLKGRAGARLRVGDWRIIFYEERGTIIVTAVGHRRDIYD